MSLPLAPLALSFSSLANRSPPNPPNRAEININEEIIPVVGRLSGSEVKEEEGRAIERVESKRSEPLAELAFFSLL